MKKEKSRDEKIKAIVSTYAKIKGKTYDEIIAEMKIKFPDLHGADFCKAVLTEIKADDEIFEFVDKVLALKKFGENVEIVPAPVVEADLTKHIVYTPNAQNMLDKIKEEYFGEKK